MLRRNGAALAAVSVLLLGAALVSADTPREASTDSGLWTNRPVLLAEAAPVSDASLMGVLDKAGLKKSLDSMGITIGGWVEGSYTISANEPPGGALGGRVFDNKSQDASLNQLVIFAEKSVDVARKEFQWGGRVEWMWGSDAKFIHSNGLFDWDGLAGPDEQFDLTQAYIDLVFPVGNGLKVRAGKFVTTIGSETINPNTNAFFSHSYLFGYAIPFTHTGVLATYNLTKDVAISGGFSRGWEQSLEDNNGSAIDFLGGVSWTVNDQFSAIVNLSVGPQRGGESGDYRYLIDLIMTYKMTKELTLTLNADWGWEQNAQASGEDGTWYGVALYANYALSDYIALNARAEWFEDPDAVRGLGVTGSVFEVTLGVDIKPLAKDKNFSSLRVRPEIRWDYSTDAFFDGGSDNNQFTFALDVIFGF